MYNFVSVNPRFFHPRGVLWTPRVYDMCHLWFFRSYNSGVFCHPHRFLSLLSNLPKVEWTGTGINPQSVFGVYSGPSLINYEDCNFTRPGLPNGFRSRVGDYNYREWGRKGEEDPTTTAKDDAPPATTTAATDDADDGTSSAGDDAHYYDLGRGVLFRTMLLLLLGMMMLS